MKLWRAVAYLPVWIVTGILIYGIVRFVFALAGLALPGLNTLLSQ